MPFFNYYLKGKGTFNPAEATVFDTGLNEWKSYAAWPPKATKNDTLYLEQNGFLASVNETETTHLLSNTAGSDFIISHGPDFVAPSAYDEYLSDPAHPVPYTASIQGSRNNEYMIEDQRFADQRPDVLTYQTKPLAADLTVAGPLGVDLWVSTSGTDADFVVKLIDVLPDDTPNPVPNPKNVQLAGAQRLVRADVFRGRFRNSLEKPAPFQPNLPTEVKYALNDVLHTFKKGHRLLVQVQSTWFPLVDRNPQQFGTITPGSPDFQKATIRIYHEPGHASGVQLPLLK